MKEAFLNLEDNLIKRRVVPYSILESVKDKEELLNTVAKSGRVKELEEALIESAVAPIEKLSAAFSILSYNQDILQFADSKANTLIVINSIFLASATSFFSNVPHYLMYLAVAFFVFSIYATALCLLVVTPKSDRQLREVRSSRKDLIFFGDVLTRDPKRYVKDFKRYRFPELLEDVALRIYRVSLIASSKYKILGKAQNATVIAAFFWLTTISAVILNYLK